MSAFVDGLVRHVLASIDVEVIIFPHLPDSQQIQISAGDGDCVHLSVEQAEELAFVLNRAIDVLSRAKEKARAGG